MRTTDTAADPNDPTAVADSGGARPKVLLAMEPGLAERLFTGRQLDRLTSIARTDPALVAHDLRHPSPAVRDALATADALLTCWGAPVLDAEALAAAPRLTAVVHAAGSVRGHITAACWERGIAVSSAAAANAVPVAEYTLAAILFAGKRVLPSARRYAELRTAHDWGAELAGAGNHRRTVGVVGASRIGRLVIGLLRPFDLDVLVYDPYLDGAEAAALGAAAVGLDELCARGDVVTVHAPELPETRRLIDARRLALMPDGATLINTSRGSLVAEDALVRELESGRLHAVLDVTEPEVPAADSPLYSLPNVLLTPHLAGSLGNELHRLADAALAELERFARGVPFATPVTRESLHHSA